MKKHIYHQQLKHFITTILIILTSGIFYTEAKWDILGLFTVSNCAQERSYICADALMTANKIAEDKNWYGNSDLCFVDTQNSLEVITDVVLTLVEAPSVNVSGRCINRNGKTVFKSSEKPAIFIYVSFDHTRYISYLMLNEELFLVAITEHEMYPSQILEKDLYVFSHESSFDVENQMENTHRITNGLNITYLGIVYLKEFAEDEEIIKKDCKDRSDSAFCHHAFLDVGLAGKCYKEILIDYNNRTDVDEKMEQIEKDSRLRMLIVYGYRPSFEKFSKYPLLDGFEAQNSSYFLIPFTRKFTNETSTYVNLNEFVPFQNVPGGRSITEVVLYITGFEKMLIEGEYGIFEGLQRLDSKYQTMMRFIIPGYKPGQKLTFEDWNAVDIKIRERVAKIFSTDFEVMKKMLLTWKEMQYFKEKSVDNWKETFLYNPVKVINESKPFCDKTIPLCGKGKELQHGFYVDRNWTNTYGWHCRECPKDTYKDMSGNVKCKPCIYPLKTKLKQTVCFDPFRNDYIELMDPVVLSTLSLSSVSALLVIVTMIVFVRLRETPMVKMANRSMTCVQLTSHFLLMTAPHVLFIGMPTYLKCIFKPSVIGLCFTATVSVNLAKTQKLHVIFNSKTKHTRGQVKAIGVLEWVITCVLLLVDAGMLLAAFQSKETRIEYFYIDEEYIREVTCNNNSSVVYQLVFMLGLVLANGIQAFRARHLPSHFKETSHVIYSSFTSVVLLGALSAMYFTQKIAVVRDMILWVCVLMINLLHFSLIYLYKLYVMLFRPHLNTRAAFNSKRKSKIVSQFERK